MLDRPPEFLDQAIEFVADHDHSLLSERGYVYRIPCYTPRFKNFEGPIIYEPERLSCAVKSMSEGSG